jgi:5-aminopentanamidase
MNSKIRIAVVQTSPRLGKKSANIAAALRWMNARPADVYVLPELAVAGYNFETRRQVAALAEPSGGGETFNALADFARRRACYVAFGFPEAAGGALYNSASLVGPKGLVGTYRKVHLFNREKLFFRPGNRGFAVHKLPFGAVGMMVCFDWFFPESVRTLALKGAQLILHPSNLVLPYCPDAMVTRCLENRVFAATANRIGREPGAEKPLTYIGLSEIVSPRGEILARLGERKEGIAVVRCDVSEARKKRLNTRNDLFRDRRPRFYAR